MATQFQKEDQHRPPHVHVRSTGAEGQGQNRNIDAAATTYAASTNSATWVTGVKEVTIVPVADATGSAIQNDEVCFVVFDAPTEAIASAWLTDTGGITNTVQYYLVRLGGERTFEFTDSITRVDVLPLNLQMRVVVEAA